MNLGFVGRYDLRKQKVKLGGDGLPLLDEQGNQILLGESWKVGAFDNLITNQGLNRIGEGGGTTNFMYLSSDNTAPKITDTLLAGMLGGSANSAFWSGASNLNSPPYYLNLLSNATFAAGVATGNISKIAVGWGQATRVDGLWSVALINNDGTPTTISKLPDEILSVSYSLKVYLDASDYTGTVDISGSNHAVTVRPSKLQDWKGLSPGNITKINSVSVYPTNIKGITESPAGNEVGYDQYPVLLPYVQDSYEIGIQSSYPVSSGNTPTGISSAVFIGQSYPEMKKSWQVSFNPPIMKTDTDTLKLPPFYIRWGRYVAP